MAKDSLQQGHISVNILPIRKTAYETTDRDSASAGRTAPALFVSENASVEGGRP